MHQTPFQVGTEYSRRKDIHALLKGQQQGGISTPADAPFVLLFTSGRGQEFGYADRFNDDGCFWYTGEGQLGDMAMDRGNAAILNHAAEGKSLLLFEQVSKGRVRFIAEASYAGHHFEQRPDRNGALRSAIVFHLILEPAGSREPATEASSPIPHPDPRTILRSLKRMSPAELRSTALLAASVERPPQVRLSVSRLRSGAIRRYALVRARGLCESCCRPAPFESREGPFLEVHHLTRLADGGPDHPTGVVAVCPNCHRQCHHDVNAKLINDDLAARVRAIDETFARQLGAA